MRPIATDRVAWSVCHCLLFCLQMRVNRLRCSLGCWFRWAQATGFRSPCREVILSGETWQPALKHSYCELCKNGWTNWDAVWGAESGGAENHVLDGMQMPKWEGALLWLSGRLRSIAKHIFWVLGKRVISAKTGGQILAMCTLYVVFPVNDVPFGVSLIRCVRKLLRQFQPNFAQGWRSPLHWWCQYFVLFHYCRQGSSLLPTLRPFVSRPIALAQ